MNFSSTNKSSERCDPYGPTVDTYDQILMTIAFVLLSIFSFTGNSLFIAVFYKQFEKLRTPVHYFIVNMAVSDLLAPIFVIPRRIKQVYLGWGPWLVGGVFGDITCKLVHFADEVSMTVSSQSMVFIAAERFGAIVFPTRRHLIPRRTTPRFIAFTWIFSTLFFSYYFFIFRLVETDNTRLCDYSLPQIFDTWQDLWRVDRLTLFVVFAAFPFILMAVFYTAIVITLRRKEPIASHLSSETQQRRAMKNKRVALMLVIVVSLFFFSWSPYGIYFLLQYYLFDASWSCDAMKRLYLCGRYMNYIYTAINPMIYYKFNEIYRHGIHQMLGYHSSCLHGCRKGKIR